MGIVPGDRPKIGLKEILKHVERADAEHEVCLVGIRGYYRDTMGERGKNDRGIYDDCIALYTPDRLLTFNANCDPGAYKVAIASLRPGIWAYKIGIHGLSKPKARQYKALVQASEVVITREGSSAYYTGFFGINIHRGGYNTVSSLGCQTIYPSQWPEFIGTIEASMKEHGQKVVNYVLDEV